MTFEFTALTGTEILASGDGEFGNGESFTMPASASATISVTDDDAALSGDNCRNEIGNDRSGEYADITVDGATAHDGVKIYIEEYYTLHGSDGRTYYLMEIEVSGASASDQTDFFAFYGDVPPAGVTLTVAGKCNVGGDWVKYQEMSAGMIWEFDADGKLTVEAEDMALMNYQANRIDAASGGEVIKLKEHEGEASLTFGAESGTYDLELAYVDENDGQGRIEVWVGGSLVTTVELDNDNNGNGANGSTISTIKIEGVAVQQGDEVVLKGARDAGEYARIDALTFFKSDGTASAPPVPPLPTPPATPGAQICLDFNTFADGSGAEAGNGGSLVFEGVTFDAIRKQDSDGVYDDAMIYDSDASSATGGDWDLLVGQGNLIIISEDGHSWDPDDNASGGTIRATFDQPATVSQIMMVDVEEAAGTIRLYDDAGNLLSQIDIPYVGDTEAAWVDLGDVAGVATMEVSLKGSGAIGGLKFTPEGGASAPLPNAGPDAADDAGATDEDAPVTINVLSNDSDPDGDALVVTAAGGQAVGTAMTLTSAAGRDVAATMAADGTLTVEPSAAFRAMAANETDTVTLTYDISDGNGGTDAATVTVTITGLNDGPMAENDATTTDEDTAVTLDLLANDSDPNGDALTVTLAGGAQPGTPITLTTEGGRTATVTVTAAGILSFDPAGGFEDMGAADTDSFTVAYQISDGLGGTTEATAHVAVQGVNDGPTALDDAYTVGESGLAVLDILTNDSDPEGDPLEITLISSPVDGAISLNADGTVTFDAGSDFLTLQDGQQATVTFDYQISDGEFTDIATVTVAVIGEGQNPEPPKVCESATGTLSDGTAMTVRLCGDETTDDGSADLSLTVNWGDTASEQYNVVYVIDVSGSTDAATIDGKTILEAQVDALKSLTEDLMASGIDEDNLSITVLPFNGRALPTEPVDGVPLFSQTFTGAGLLDGGIDSALDGLAAGGETNYVSAIFAAGGVIQQQDPTFSENNIIYFLSDGNPFPENSQPPQLLESVSAQVKAFAQIHGIAIGEVVDPSYVEAFDNSGGAMLIRDLDELGNDIDSLALLDDALREAPIGAEAILNATLKLFDADGALTDTLEFTGADFDETALGFTLDVTAAGLDLTKGDVNTAELIVAFDGDGDLVADDEVTVSVDIAGIMPESFEFA